MGHDTHGLAPAFWYLGHVADGTVAGEGLAETLSDRGAAVAWNGRRLPGAWLVTRAIDLAVARAAEFGTATVAVGNTHHIGALAACLHRATDRGLMVSLASSSPSGAQVAPFGGKTGIFTPNPVAHGIPTPKGPILIDISASITTFNMAQRLIRAGQTYPGDWVMTAEGAPSRDRAELTRGGTLLPTGGFDHGQKGYGMDLQVEALTQGLVGHGQADAPKGTNCAFTVQVWDPVAFVGTAAFLRQTGWLAEACHGADPRDPARPVRLPGEAAQAALALRGVETGPRLDDLPADLVPQSQDAAYAIQEALLDGPPAGWKVAAIQVPKPLTYAAIAARRRIEGVLPAAFEAPEFEVEIAFAIARDLPPRPAPYTEGEVRAALGMAHAAIEVIASRFRDRKAVAPLSALADALSCGAMVIGSGTADWDGLDFTALEVRLEGASHMAQVRGNATRAQTLTALTALANHASARGLGLSAGQFVITGARIGPVPLARGQTLVASVEGIGTVRLAI